MTDNSRIETARWHREASRKIKERYVFSGTLVLDTPASFSNGEVIGTELVILQDALEGHPLIPGASLAGALRNYLLSRAVGYRNDTATTEDEKTARAVVERLFGEALNQNARGDESRVHVHDALGHGKITRREGVKIDGATRTADEGMLFSAQVWEAGTTFELRCELVLYKDDSDELVQGFAAAVQALIHGEIPLGGRKNRGYGRVHVEDWQVSCYDFRKAEHLRSWLLNELPISDQDTFFEQALKFHDAREHVRLEATLQLCDSLLIRTTSDFADAEHLTSNDLPVLSGTSLAGALRARALKIAQTVNPNHAETIVNDLFGKHGANTGTTNDQEDVDKHQINDEENMANRKNENDLTASRLLVEEYPIHGGRFDYLQNRVKIDRFTGGAFDTGLMTERPVFNNGDTFVQVNLELRYPAGKRIPGLIDAELGLLLLTLKDLWLEDLPLGGEASIGRGRVRGHMAMLSFQLNDPKAPTDVQFDTDGLTDMSQSQYLQSLVDALWQYMEG